MRNVNTIRNGILPIQIEPLQYYQYQCGIIVPERFCETRGARMIMDGRQGIQTLLYMTWNIWISNPVKL